MGVEIRDYPVHAVTLADGHRYILADDFTRITHGLAPGAPVPKSLRNSTYNRISRGTIPSVDVYGRRFVRWEF